jgi:flagellar basal-body rod modification protein FlgD
MTITATSFSATNANAANGTRTKELGQDAFLRLMTEQLKNQDPLKPLASNEFLGQLAQFTQVQSLQSLNDGFSSLATTLESDQALQAASLVGRNAMFEADSLALGAEGNAALEVDSPGKGTVTVEITGEGGNVVRRYTVASTDIGPLDIAWDGKDDSGTRLPAGDYGIKTTFDGEAGTGALIPLVGARIDSVSLGVNGLTLNIAGYGTAPLSAVRRIGA